jgi:uncharacterized SAM-binding protein YcdF (DUF218 family)
LKEAIKYRLKQLLVVLVIFGVFYFSRSWTLPYVARFLDVSETPQKTSAVMVLGGGTDVRPFIAAALVKAKLADKVLVAPIKLSPEAEDGVVEPEHENIIKILVARGVARENIVLLPDTVESTFDEARGLSKYMEQNPESTVSVVTTSWHTRRARWIFANALAERSSQIRFVAAPTERFDENNWWTTEQGLFIVDEYIKLGYYCFKY